MKTALFVHSSNELYGADVILLGLLERMDRSEWQALVILPNDVAYEGRLAKRLDEIGIEYLEMKTAVLRRKYFKPAGLPVYLWYFLTSVIKLLGLIRSRKINVVHSNTTAVIPGAVAAKIARKPHVWHSHEIIIKPRIVRTVTARLAPALSDSVITVSNAVRQHMLGDNPTATNIRVLHNGIETERFEKADGRQRIRSEFGFTESDIVVGTLARISRGKGHGYLMEAAARLKDAHPNLKYLLVGDAFVGQEFLVDELKELIASLGLTERVALAGYRTDAPDILSAIDIAVLPSTLPDSFPTIIMEAMASAKPMISTDWGGAKEMLVDGETGYLVPIDDVQVFSDRLERLVSSEELRTSMGKAGRKRVNELFTRERMAKEFWNILGELAS